MVVLIAIGATVLVAASVVAVVLALSKNKSSSPAAAPQPAPTTSVAKTTPPRGQTLDTSSARALVGSYYDLLNAGRFSNAWQALSPQQQAADGSYSTWKAGYATTARTQVTGISGESASKAVTNLTVTVRSTVLCNGTRYHQDFSGPWVVYAGAALIISDNFVLTGGDTLPAGC